MSGHLDGPPPGPPDPPYIPGDLGAPSAEEFARRRRAAGHEKRKSPDVRRWEVEVCDECGREVSDSTHATSAHQNGPTHFEPVVAAADYDRLPAASPDERLREAGNAMADILNDGQVETCSPVAVNASVEWRAALAAADREKPDEPCRICCRGMGADGGCNICAAEATR